MAASALALGLIATPVLAQDAKTIRAALDQIGYLQ